MQDAFAALLKGDTSERDRQCDLANHILDQEIRVKEGGPSPVDLTRDRGIVIPDRRRRTDRIIKGK